MWRYGRAWGCATQCYSAVMFQLYSKCPRKNIRAGHMTYPIVHMRV